MHNADLTLWPFEGGFAKKLKKKRKLQILECLLVSVLRNINGKLYFVVSLQDSLHFLDY